MFEKLIPQLQRKALDMEQRFEHARGRCMGWTNAFPGARHLYHEVARAVTENGLMNVVSKDFPLKFPDRTDTGIKIYNRRGKDLSDYWRVVDGVREKIGYGQVTYEKLQGAIMQTVDDANEGLLKDKHS